MMRPALLTAHSASVPAGVPAPGSGAPAWLQDAYDLTWLSATKGAGDTVAVVDAYSDPTIASDLATYRSSFGLPACTTASGCLRIVNQNGQGSPLPPSNSDWESEETIDLDAISALCPNCSILLVEANSTNWDDLVAGDATAASMGANQISDSWGSVVPAGQGPTNWPANLSRTSGGPEVVAADGDSGVVPSGQVSVPASYPTVTAVGGTSLSQASGALNARGFAESAWTSTGSGCDTSEPSPSWQPSGVCSGRAFSDVSADADPNTGLDIYSTALGGWAVGGGTSLSTPLVAAFEALTGVAGDTPQWAYANAGVLNDPTGGSNGSCSGLAAIICVAGLGYDGPTGAGSISGAVVQGAPGVAWAHAGTIANSTAVLTGGLDANGVSSSYVWQYGTTTGYGSQTTPVSAGSGRTPQLVTAALAGLAPGTTYHYRLVAYNADGTSYGYDNTFTTGGSGSGSSTQTATTSSSNGSPWWNPSTSKPKAHTASRKKSKKRARKHHRAHRKLKKA